MNKNYCPYCMTLVPEGESCSVCGLTSGTYVPSPHHLPPGTVLMDRYLVGRVLGEGGFGITYIGRDLRLELKVAIKEYYPVDRATRNASASLEVTNFIGPSAKSFERGKQKFLGEAQVMARMDKQQVIVSVRDFFEINNTAYIVMEYIEGITFHELVEKKGGKIPPKELFPMIEPLFHALTIMHENGLIHRDISPDNLMLENGRVRLLDFGCAREASRGTETMTIALKHGYAPIEQYQQKGQGPWTDIYALSATIYYCLTGKIPPQALDRIAEDELLVPSKLGISLSANQEKALLKGMKLQPNRRFSTAEEMWVALYTKSGGETETQTEMQMDAVPKVHTAPAIQTEAPAHIATKTQAVSSEHVASEVQPDEETENQVSPKDEEANHEELPEGKSLKAVPEKVRKICLFAGTMAAIVLVIVAIWRENSKETVISSGTKLVKGTENEMDGEGTGTTGESGKSETDFPDSHMFDQADTFTSGDGQAFRDLMDDSEVSAIIIACRNLDVSNISITKPVVVAKDAYWAADHLTIEGEGYLQVEGQLDLTGSSYLRLMGKELRLFVADGGEITTEDTFLWMDDECCFGATDSVEISGYKLVFSGDVFDGSNVISVTSKDSLIEAMDSNSAISIDADITLDRVVYFQVPVRVSEGVTVASEVDEEGRPFSFSLGEGGILINNGTFCGNVYTHEPNAVVVNNGTFGLEASEVGEAPSFWFEKESVLVNFGTIHAQDCSRIWETAFFLNMGTMYSHDFFLPGGKLTNFGSIILEKPEHFFEIINNGLLRNKKEATLTISDGAEFCNNGRIHNQGIITVLQDGLYANAVLSNDGIFMVSKRGRIDQDRIGIYYGAGEFLTEDSRAKFYKVYDAAFYMPECRDRLSYVGSAEELEEALENPEVEAVCVKADILVEKDLTVRKSLFIDRGCSLSLSGGAKLLDYGNCLMLLEGGTLQGSDIVMYEDAQIYMEADSDLTVNEGGTLTLDGSLLWGNGGRIKISGAELTLKNKAGFAPIQLDFFETAQGKIILQDQGVFVTPANDGMELSEAEIILRDNAQASFFYATSDLTLKDCSLDIRGGSVFRNSATDLVFQNCTVMIGEESEIQNGCANLSLLSGTTLENRGVLEIWGWDEYSVTVHGRITNFGDINIGIVPELSEPIDNRGKLTYFDAHKKWEQFDWEKNVVGNAAIRGF